jgi:hypothetical protein
MKKGRSTDEDEMPAEFDFSKSIPNPWFVAVHGAEYVRVIDKDLADVFPDNDSMNTALRVIADTRRRCFSQKISKTRIAPATKKVRS